ncbi:MAG: S8 family serine peptidase, partial [Oscillospiraceae bacterium]
KVKEDKGFQRFSTYLRATDTVFVCGAAPDAQIITLKVAGVGGGIAESDYMAAIEDAILLDCDAVNLSLGSNMPGEVYNNTSVYAELLDYLAKTDTVVTVSSGNSNQWAVRAGTGGYLYNDDVSFATGGSPGTCANTLTVASVDSTGAIGPHLLVDDKVLVYYESTDFGNLAMSNLDKTQDGSGTEYPFVYVDGFGVATDFDGIDLNGKVVFCSRGGGLNFADKANNALWPKAGCGWWWSLQQRGGIFGMNLTGYIYAAQPACPRLRSQANAVKAAVASEAEPTLVRPTTPAA